METSKSVQAKIVPSVPDDLPMVYSNMVTVSRTPHEFFLTFCLIQPSPGQSAEGPATVSAEAQVQVALPHPVAEAMVGIIEAQTKTAPPESKPSAAKG